MTRRLALTVACLTLIACDDFEQAYAQCLDAGACVPPVSGDPPGEPSADTSTLEQTLSEVVADGTAATQFTLTVRDARARAIPNQTVLMSSTGLGNRFTPETGRTDAQGVFVSRLSATRPGARSVSASAGAVVLTTQVTFVVGKPDPQLSSLIALPAMLVADGTASTELSVTLRDVTGNAVTNTPVTVSVSGTGTALDPMGPYTTDGAGSVKVSLRSTSAETKTVTATAAGTTLTTSVVFQPGPISPAASTVTAMPTSVVADGVATSTITVTLRDAFGNGVPAQALALRASGTGNTLAAVSGFSGASGSFSTTLASTTAETKSVTATIGGLVLTAPVVFLPGPAADTTSTLVVAPPTVLADGVATASVTATLRDVNGNALSAEPLSLRVSGTGNTLAATSAMSGDGGVFVTTLSSTVAEAKTVTLTSGGLTKTAPVTFLPSAPSATTSSVTSTPQTAVANGVATTRVAVVLRDAQGNAIAGAPLSLSSSGTANQLTPASGVSDATGRFESVFSSTVAEQKVLTATSGAFVITGSATFTPGPVHAPSSSLAAMPQTVPANGTSPVALTVTLRDAQGNAVRGQAVSLSATGTGNTFTPPSGATNDGGVFVASLSSTGAGTKTITAAAGTVQLTTAVTFRPVVSASQSTVAVSSASVPADGNTSATVTVTIRDAMGVAISGETVTLAYSGNVSPSPVSVVTDALGVATFTLLASAPTTGSLSASTPTVTVTESPTLDFVQVYPVIGTVVGLTTSGLILSTPTLPNLTVPQNATTFSFARGLAEGASYAVTVNTQPGGARCTTWAARGTMNSTTPPAVVVVCHAPWSKVSTGSDGHTLALTNDGTLWAWGVNTEGQTGLGNRVNRPIPGRVGAGFSDIAAGRQYSLAVKTDGTLWAWGAALWGEMGFTPPTFGVPVLTPVQVGSANTWSRVWAARQEFSMAMRTDGALMAFGRNQEGQLGLGDTNPRSVPALVGFGYSTVSLGDWHALGLRTDGTLHVWGGNQQGQLGLGDTTPRLSPTPLGGGYAAVAAGSMHSLAVTDGGTLFTWGIDTTGELGNGPGNSSTSTPVSIGTGYVMVAGGAGQSLAKKNDGSLWQWGSSSYSIGPSCSVAAGWRCQSPEQLSASLNLSSLVSGQDCSMGLTSAGALWVWGNNQLAKGLEEWAGDGPVPGP